jgi:phosphoribosylamine--glycine ligase
VVKADGLAAGKGVVVAEDAEQAHAAVDEMFSGRFGAAGETVVIEERLVGPELSVLALCDGRHAVPMLACRDHKRRFESDCGPNTGGMGAVCPAQDTDSGMIEQVRREVLTPVVEGMAAQGTPFRGILYAGLMWTETGPRVLEFNVRFGDPECQPLLFMLDQDLVPLALACAQGRLESRPLRWRSGASCCVVMVAGEYPGQVPRGMPITGLPEPTDDLRVFLAGARSVDGVLEAAGGRVLGVTARGADLEQARRRAYRAVAGIHFDTASWRRDIGGGVL